MKELWTVQERKLGKLFSICCDCNELFTLTLYGIPVSAQYVSFMPAVLQIDEPVRNDKIEKKVTLFPKWNINMAIQSQILSMHVLTSQLYMLQHMSKKHPSTCCFAKKTLKTQQVEGFTHTIITNDFLSCYPLRWYVCAREDFASVRNFPFL